MTFETLLSEQEQAIVAEQFGKTTVMNFFREAGEIAIDFDGDSYVVVVPECLSSFQSSHTDLNSAISAAKGVERLVTLWSELGDLPFDETVCAEEGLADQWLHFEPGTSREDIWHWFESEFSCSVAEDLFGLSFCKVVKH